MGRKIPAANPLPELLPGDVLLYFRKGSLVDILVGFRTWCWSASHVEVYAGQSTSWASRNGVGVGQYGFRRAGLRHVLRPVGKFDLAGAQVFFERTRGTPYGWADLLRFYSIRIHTRGMICSQFGDLLLRAAGVPAFSAEYLAGAICPRDFLVSGALRGIWRGR